jgi:transposase-like protein
MPSENFRKDGFATLHCLETRHRKYEVEEEVDPKPCPRCGSTDTRLSRRDKGLLAFLMSFVNLSRYRCRACKRHFTARN